MTLATAIRSELVKSRRTSVWLLSLVAAFIGPLYSYLDSTAIYRVDAVQADPWNVHMTGMGPRVLNMMILPFFLMLICTLQAQLEYRNNTWKQVYVSPLPLLKVYLAKFMVIQFMLLGVIVLSCALMVGTLFGVDRFGPPLDLAGHGLDWPPFLLFWSRIYLTVLGISAFQFWLGLRFRSFVVPLVIGICLYLAAAMMMEEHPLAHDKFYPYLYPLRNCFPKDRSEVTTMLWGSAAYTILFLLLGFLDFRRKPRTS
jgi:hypothetical protein